MGIFESHLEHIRFIELPIARPSQLSERASRMISTYESNRPGHTPYLLVAGEPNFQYVNWQNIGGWNIYYAGGELQEMLGTIGPAVGQAQGMVVFTGEYSSADAARSTAMHEIAHSFQIGEVDDSCDRAGTVGGGEIYSGENLDRTDEFINGARWSIMSRGSARMQQPGSYFAFSVEELLSIEQALSGDVPCSDNT